MARRIRFSIACLAGALASSAIAFGGDGKAPTEPPKPPTTPVPTFENPLADAKIGETLFYKVRDLEGKTPTAYFEERVLALTKDLALIETIVTDETDSKVYSVDNSPSLTGWKSRSETLKGSDVQKWVAEKAKPEILYLGEPPTKAIRTIHRYLDEPKDFSLPEGPRRTREIWYSHDVAATGRAKMYPAQRGGERVVISWDKVLSVEECAKRAARFPEPDDQGGTKTGANVDPEPGMGEPGMAEPGMEEPGMDAPKKEEPGMGEAPSKSDPGMSG